MTRAPAHGSPIASNSLQARPSLCGEFTPRDAFGTARCARFASPSSPLRSDFAFTPPRSGAAHLAKLDSRGCCLLWARIEGEKRGKNWAVTVKGGCFRDILQELVSVNLLRESCDCCVDVPSFFRATGPAPALFALHCCLRQGCSKPLGFVGDDHVHLRKNPMKHVGS